MRRSINDHRQKMTYLTAVTKCKKGANRVHLHELEAALPKCKDSIFSWMQWRDAKNFFHAGSDTEGVYYYLRPEYEDAPPGEVYKAIHKFFNPNYDGE